MDLAAALLNTPEPARTQPKPAFEAANSRPGSSFADIAQANARANERAAENNRAASRASTDRANERANAERANTNRANADKSSADRANAERANERANVRAEANEANANRDDPRFEYGAEDLPDRRRTGGRLQDLPLDEAFIEAVRKVVSDALQESTGKSALFGGSENGELFSGVTDLGKIASEALLLALAPTAEEAGNLAEGTADAAAELLADAEGLLTEGEVPQIAGVAQTAANPGEGEKAAPTPVPANPSHIVSLPNAGDSLAADGTEQVRTETQTVTSTQVAGAAQQVTEIKQPAQMAAPAAEAAQIETPREVREGDRAQMAGPRGETAGSDLSRMQRVTGPAVLSQHHNGILVADTGHRNYEIRFASAELGQIRVELQMDGQKPEASILFNNADAEKPLRDQFTTLQARLASLGIENLVLRQDTAGGWGNNGAPGFGNGQAGQDGTGEKPMPAMETEYYLMVPELTADGRLDIRF